MLVHMLPRSNIGVTTSCLHFDNQRTVSIISYRGYSSSYRFLTADVFVWSPLSSLEVIASTSLRDLTVNWLRLMFCKAIWLVKNVFEPSTSSQYFCPDFVEGSDLEFECQRFVAGWMKRLIISTFPFPSFLRYNQLTSKTPVKVLRFRSATWLVLVF